MYRVYDITDQGMGRRLGEPEPPRAVVVEPLPVQMQPHRAVVMAPRPMEMQPPHAVAYEEPVLELRRPSKRSMEGSAYDVEHMRAKRLAALEKSTAGGVAAYYLAKLFGPKE